MNLPYYFLMFPVCQQLFINKVNYFSSGGRMNMNKLRGIHEDYLEKVKFGDYCLLQTYPISPLGNLLQLGLYTAHSRYILYIPWAWVFHTKAATNCDSENSRHCHGFSLLHTDFLKLIFFILSLFSLNKFIFKLSNYCLIY